MGNRATVQLKSDNKDRGIYFHWHGEQESIAAFLHETKRRYHANPYALNPDSILAGVECDDREESKTIRFYAALQAVASEYLAYGSPNPDCQADSAYLLSNGAREGGCDNGCYLIEDDFTCPNVDTATLTDENYVSYNHINMDEFTAEQRTDYDSILTFFEDSRHAMNAIAERKKSLHNP